MYDDKIWVFDDIVDFQYQKHIANTLLSNKFNWFFLNDITDNKGNIQGRPGFEHNYVVNEKVNSDFHMTCMPIIEAACDRIGFKYEKIIQGRSFLQLPLKGLTSKSPPDSAHVDLNYRHLVVLYYVINSEGDTVISEQKDYNEGRFRVQKRVTPKMGRCVVFDGRFWHYAYQPDENKRCIINYNLV